MLGAIAGDVIGSVHEGAGTKTKDFRLFVRRSRFTDDSVLTSATADALLTEKGYVAAYHEYYHDYPLAGYGGQFIEWAHERRDDPYYSWGNGSAMRVSPVGWAFDTLDAVLAEARRSAAVTHDHPEGIKGAQATATAVFLARTGATKDDIRREITDRFGYDLDTPLGVIRPMYTFDVSCQGSVPQSIRAFLESTDYEDAVRNAISLGGDADTMACISGAIAEPFYGGVPADIEREVLARLDERLTAVLKAFRERFPVPPR
jgi:ADP-ribosylglycohydrolase